MLYEMRHIERLAEIKHVQSGGQMPHRALAQKRTAEASEGEPPKLRSVHAWAKVKLEVLLRKTNERRLKMCGPSCKRFQGCRWMDRDGISLILRCYKLKKNNFTRKCWRGSLLLRCCRPRPVNPGYLWNLQ